MTEVTTLTLTDFLLARIAEDEAVAQATVAGSDPLDWTGEPWYDAWHLHGPVDGPSDYGALVVDPARVLAECEAKRRIVEIVARNVRDVDPGWLTHLLSVLAGPYADHPDFRPEWRS